MTPEKILIELKTSQRPYSYNVSKNMEWYQVSSSLEIKKGALRMLRKLEKMAVKGDLREISLSWIKEKGFLTHSRQGTIDEIVYFKSMLGEREVYSIEDISKIIEDVIIAINDDEKHLDRLVKSFPATIRLLPFFQKKDTITLGLLVPPDILTINDYNIEQYDRAVKHYQGESNMFAFINFFITDENTLVVYNIQSDFHASLKKGKKKELEDWPKMLLESVERFAMDRGLNRILVVTGEHVLNTWTHMDERIIRDIYGVPEKMGYERLILSFHIPFFHG